MAELTLKDYVLKGLRAHWEWPVKHNDGFTAGVPDLSGWMPRVGTVWIELKALDAWPKRKNTRVRFGLEELQRLFLKHHRGWLLVRVGREYLLFNHIVTAQVIDTAAATQFVVRTYATKIWNRRIMWPELAKILRRVK